MKLFGFGVAGTAGFFAQIGIPLAAVAAPLVIGLEFLGGIALVLGLFTRWIALPLAVTMVVAIVTVHLSAGFFLPNGYEFALIMLAGTLTLALQGSGALALDNVWRPVKDRPTVNERIVAA
jgi:putative oxidoreductase